MVGVVEVAYQEVARFALASVLWRSLGCHQVAYYLFGRPLSLVAVIAVEPASGTSFSAVLNSAAVAGIVVEVVETVARIIEDSAYEVAACVVWVLHFEEAQKTGREEV